jgi:group I intron endonuclease
MVGIYKITSPSGKIYIGQSWDIIRRFENYRRCSPRQQSMYNSIKKYGYDNHIFEVLHELPEDINQTILDNYEILYWKSLKEGGMRMLNIREPGRGGKMSAESIKKISESLIGNKRSLGYKHSKETCEKRRRSSTGRILSDECKKKISDKLKGRKFSEERRLAISIRTKESWSKRKINDK